MGLDGEFENRQQNSEYLIQNKEEGLYLTDQTNNRRFFRTNMGGWFWLNSPFDEDAVVNDKEDVAYLDSLVETATGKK